MRAHAGSRGAHGARVCARRRAYTVARARTREAGMRVARGAGTGAVPLGRCELWCWCVTSRPLEASHGVSGEGVQRSD